MKTKTFLLLVIICFFCETLKAQIKVCDGQSVELQATDYVAGDIQWEFSENSTLWNELPGATNLTETIYPSETAWYRLRITDPNCLPVYYSNPVEIIVVHSPIITGCNMVTDSSIVFTWSEVAQATAYRIDVALDSSFTNFLLGYEDLQVVADTSLTVVGLSMNMEYYYRVKSETNNCETPYSTIESCCTTADSWVFDPVYFDAYLSGELICSGAEACLHFFISNPQPGVFYQWRYNYGLWEDGMSTDGYMAPHAICCGVINTNTWEVRGVVGNTYSPILVWFTCG